MDLVDDADAVAAPGRAIGQALLQLPDVVDPGIGGPVDLEDVQREVESLARGGPSGPGPDRPTLIPPAELEALTKGISRFPAKRGRGRPAGGRSTSPRALRDDEQARGQR